MAERKAWWEILRDQFASRGLLDPESERVQETVRAAPAAQRQARGLLSLDPQAESDTALEMGLGALPGVGQAMALRDLERARRAKDPGAAAMAASNFIPFGALLNRFRRGPMSELDVYHGTPHTYAPTEANPLGEFDASKIGTGEGAQAYGHGIYLAERPELAEYYRKALTPPTDINDWSAGSLRIKKRGDYLDYSPKSNSPMDEARAILTENLLIDENTIRNAFDEGGIEKARAIMLGVADHTATVRPDLKPYLNVLRKNLNEQLIFNATKNQGAILKADLPDEMIDRMLDWDKPLSEQSAAVREALTPIVKAAMKKRGTPDRALEYSANRAIGGDIVKDLLVGNGVTRADVSRIMQQAGIPGIKYLDAGSRGQGGSGTRNFVVFPGEEKKVKILERK